MTTETKELEVLPHVDVGFNFWDWVKKTFTVDYQKEITDYLSLSTDHADLEFRMNILARRGLL